MQHPPVPFATSGKDEADLRRVLGVHLDHLRDRRIDDLAGYCLAVAQERNPRTARVVLEARTQDELVAGLAAHLAGDAPPVLTDPRLQALAAAFLAGRRCDWTSAFPPGTVRGAVPDTRRTDTSAWIGRAADDVEPVATHEVAWQPVEVPGPATGPLSLAVTPGEATWPALSGLQALARRPYPDDGNWRDTLAGLPASAPRILVALPGRLVAGLAAEECLTSLTGLARALADAAPHAPTLTVVLPPAAGVDAVEVSPGAAAAAAFLQTLATENPGWTIQVLDADASLTANAAHAAAGSAAELPRLAVRAGDFHRPHLRRLVAAEGAAPLTGHGAYLVTGGTGGIGLEVARLLTGVPGAVVALLARRSVDLADPGAPAASPAGIARLARERGTTVLAYAADVADRDAVAAVLADLRGRGHAIRGIFHAAGIAGDGFLARKTAEAFAAVIAPKIAGARHLHELTVGDPIEQFVLFSSVAAVFAPPGQTDYAAGNAYLDALAVLRGQRRLPGLSINWTAWRDTGMAVAHGVNHDTALRAVSTPRALKTLEFLMSARVTGALVGDLNTDSRVSLALRRLPYTLAPELARELERAEADLHALDAGPAALAPVLDAVRRVTGLADPDLDASLLDLGADSLLLSRLREELQAAGHPVTVADLFAHPSIRALAAHLDTTGVPTAPRPARAPVAAAPPSPAAPRLRCDIAVVGIGVHLPGARTPDDLADLLRAGRVVTGELPLVRRAAADAYLDHVGHPARTYLHAAYADDIDRFDHRYYGIAPRDADTMDPHHRVFLDVASRAVEDAGMALGGLAGTATGVFVGSSPNLKANYGAMLSDCEPAALDGALSANIGSSIPARFAFQHDCRGPAVLIDTACSSSLAAVIAACRSLQAGECTLAVAGGVRLDLLPVAGALSLGIESTAGELRPFDADADGVVTGEGAAAVVLKPLADALADGDDVYAVIRGAAWNQDGRTASPTAPDAAAQRRLLLDAWDEADVDPASLAFVEAHGTGTRLGDTVEVEALTAAFAEHTDRVQTCSLGSVKASLGHLYEAAGIAGLVKAVLMLRSRTLYPSVGFAVPNPEIDFVRTPVHVQAEAASWVGDGPMRGGVSAFGLSGTNCHVVLEEAPVPAPAVAGPVVAGPWPFVFSNHGPDEVRADIAAFAAVLARSGCTDADLPELSLTLCAGRDPLPHRFACAAATAEELLALLQDVPGPGWFRGSHTVIAAGAASAADALAGGLTPGEVRRHTESADAALAGGRLSGALAAFVAGGVPDWGRLYPAGTRRRHLPVPTRTETRHWFRIVGVPHRQGLAELDRILGAETDPGRHARVRACRDELAALLAEYAPAEPETASFTLLAPGREATDLERTLAALWHQHLGFAEIAVDSNFFALGGDSIKALQIVNGLNTLGHAVSMGDLMQYQTIEALAIRLGAAGAACDDEVPADVVVRLRAAEDDPLAACSFVSVDIDDPDCEQLEAAIWRAYRAHPELARTYEREGDGYAARTTARVRDDFVLETEDAEDAEVADRLDAWRTYVAGDFGPDTGEWFRFVLVTAPRGATLALYHSTAVLAPADARALLDAVVAPDTPTESDAPDGPTVAAGLLDGAELDHVLALFDGQAVQ